MNKENEFKQPRSASPEGEVLNIIEKIEGTAEEKRAEKNWLGNLKGKFDKIFKGEKELPPMAVDIFYAPHATAEDIKGLEEHFRRADIYIPENMAWSRADLVEMNKIAQGKIDPVLFSEMTRIEPDDRFSFEKKQMQLIYKSGKPIAFIDIPRGHPLERRFFKLKTGGIDISGSFNAMLENFKTATLEMGRIQKKREEYMLSQLKPAVREILKKHGELRQKGEINVLVCLGSFHTGFYHALARSGESVSRKFPEMPYIFSFQDEAARRGFLGFEISDELAAKGLLEMFFYYYFEDDLRKLTHHTERALSLIRKMASDFSFLEIHDLYYEANFEDKKGFKDFLLKKLKEKGIKFPQSEQELDAFLGIGKK